MKNNARLLPESLVEFLKFFLEEIEVQEQELQRREEELKTQTSPPREDLKFPPTFAQLPPEVQRRVEELRLLPVGRLLWGLKEIIKLGLSIGHAPGQEVKREPPAKGTA